ncbi:NifB/NifX family molybdenum-iron cluster-binding protein [Anaerovorax odorimutans]|uniref:NifB/NifX family molybdenum-iron cluster-binding protein n=1 Tax=Anaerovorax odorimutans TaxID=109327 RepID=UPI00040B22D9|nr:NifB/NifX family molybdenum-iron cluster-binding protein [Anaerovorax odorimutans]
MKIAIPVDENNEETKVCISFGRTPYFLIYDTDSKEKTYLNNSAAASQGGAGIKTSQVLVDNDINAIITPRCGDNAAEVLKAANIKIYKTKNDSVDDNINSFLENNLSSLEDIHEGFHN